LKLATIILAMGMTTASYGANITINMVQTSLFGTPGSVLTYSGSLTNNTAVVQNLNGANLSGFGTFATDTTPFFNNAPFFLTANQVTSIFALFTVTVPSNAAPGSVTGLFTILGGPGINDQSVIGTAPTITATATSSTATPEPATLGFMFAGLAGMALARRRLVAK
jgi:hypothetical protein